MTFATRVLPLTARRVLGGLLFVIATTGCQGNSRPDVPHVGDALWQKARFAKCAQTAGEGSQRCLLYSPSLTELIVRPEWYNSERVRVWGVLANRFENRGLFVSREAFSQPVLAGAIWLNLTRAQEAAYAALDGHWVIVDGVYKGGPGGNANMFGGEITVADLRAAEPTIEAPALPPRPKR